MTLRGAGVEVDSRAVLRVFIALIVIALTALVVVFALAAAHRNDQVNQLRDQGVRVEVTVVGCRGLPGGSGSNLAGYTCQAAYSIGGHHYSQALPGYTLHARGTTLEEIVVPSQPRLLSSVHLVATEHATWRVFILPAILFVVLLALVGYLVSRRRPVPDRSPQPAPAGSP